MVASAQAVSGQAPVLAVIDDNGRARVSMAPVLVAHTLANRQTVTAEISALVAWQTTARQVVTSQAAILAASDGTTQTYPRTSQLAMLVAYGTGLPSKDRGRAWIFDFDGHRFYVLDLGEEGTWLYDFTTQQWSRFDTVGYEDLWNATLGVYWEAQRATVVSDRVNSYLHLIDPAQPLDESWRPIEYVVTGGLEARNRPFYSQDSFRLVVSAGEIADPLGATMSLRFSDDQAHTWTTMESITIAPGAYGQEHAWRSLGALRAPGRVFEVTDTGGVIRIDVATAEIEGMDDGSAG